MINKEMLRAIKKCPLFDGIGEEQLPEALEFYGARAATYSRGEALNRVGEVLHFFGLVVRGTVCVSRAERDGSYTVMATVSPGQTFGESLCYLGKQAQVYITAMQDTEVLCMNTESIRREGGGELHRRLKEGFVSMLAQRTLEMNDRIQILSAVGLREKVVRLLRRSGGRRGGEYVTLPYDRETMAAYIGSDRAALSRVLGQMKKEGVLEFHKNKFKLL